MRKTGDAVLFVMLRSGVASMIELLVAGPRITESFVPLDAMDPVEDRSVRQISSTSLAGPGVKRQFGAFNSDFSFPEDVVPVATNSSFDQPKNLSLFEVRSYFTLSMYRSFLWEYVFGNMCFTGRTYQRNTFSLRYRECVYRVWQMVEIS